ncbi:IclR family transcriptional regulator [Enterovirga sp.]|uniref:IclR family transcriptional regulator n=1 Tax=Enterovirga sp. TaxID=2026350 RepID=UPI002629E794|nr:IclR family transcriptional regulator [Enterovirga sp.]MDB5591709.1 IclR family transcriptional regulator [Enterovirga sp.]
MRITIAGRARGDAQQGEDEVGVVSLARGLELMRAFGTRETPLANKDLAERARLPKPTVARLTYTLVETGFLSVSAEGPGYRPGEKMRRLGAACLASLPLTSLARPAMQRLADRFDISVALGAPDRESMVYLVDCCGPGTVAMRLRAGTSVPLTETAMGRAYLWAAAPELRERRLAEILAADPEGGEARVANCRAGFAEADRTGFVSSFGQWLRHVSAVGAPVWLGPDEPLLALNAGTSRRISEATFRGEVGPALVEVAAEIASAMGAAGQTFWGE